MSEVLGLMSEVPCLMIEVPCLVSEVSRLMLGWWQRKAAAASGRDHGGARAALFPAEEAGRRGERGQERGGLDRLQEPPLAPLRKVPSNFNPTL